MSILLVVDSASLRKSLAGIFADENHDIAESDCISNAIIKLTNRQFDLVLLDNQLQKRTDMALMDWLKENHRNESVVVVDADESADDALNALRRGAADYLSRPYHIDLLKNAVNRVLEQRRLMGLNELMKLRLQDFEQRLHYLVEQSPDMVYSLDKHGCFTYVSPGVEPMLGYPPRELLGQHCSILIPKFDVPGIGHAFFERRTGSRASRNVKLALRRNPSRCAMEQDGGVINTILNAQGTYSLENGNTQFLGSYGVVRDLGGWKRLHDEIVDSNPALQRKFTDSTCHLKEANRYLEAFSYSVSHDLRTPLRAINGFASILHETAADRLSGSEMQQLGRIIKNANRMELLIDGMLQLSHIGRAKLKKNLVNMAVIAAELKTELSGLNPRAEVRIGELPLARGDAVLLRQVLNNLIANALKYSSKIVAPVIEVGYCNIDGKDGAYYVQDNGAGFDMEYSAKLFEPFQRMHSQENFQGTGIGLAVVKNIVERHGGRVWAESYPDKGAKFFFYLGTD